MTNNLSLRLRGIFGRCFYSLKPQGRNISTRLPSRYDDVKYGELKHRLATIPCLNMLNKEVERVHNDVCYEKDERIKDVLKYISQVFKYNVGTGHNLRSVILLKSYCTYGYNTLDANWNNWDSENWRLVVILAWCLELYQAHIILLDDIVDQSVLRRGKLCWYKMPEVGKRAIGDSLCLENGIYKLLQKYFSASKVYTNILHEFFQMNRETILGFHSEYIFNINQATRSIKTFNFETYQTCAEYKTANYTYRLPVHLAMHLAGGYSLEDFDFTKKLCFKLGLYIQSLDDLLDVFGKPEITGKSGNDILEGKCTWLSVKFLEEASESMKKQFLENYGVDEKEAAANVVKLYIKANLLERFQAFEDMLYSEITMLIESSNDIRSALFYELFDEVKQRKKYLDYSYFKRSV